MIGSLKNQNSEIVIYLGTRKLVALRGDVKSGEIHMTQCAILSDPEGFKNGLVINLERAVASIETLLGSLFSVPPGKVFETEEDFGLYVVLGNPKLKTHTFSSSEYYQGFRRTISTHDIQSVVEQTRSVATLPLSEFIIQTLPDSFIVNDLEGVTNPLGMEAQRLGVHLKMFTMDAQDFKNLSKVFESMEVEVKGYFPKMLTASEVILTEEEKNEGVLLVDIAEEVTYLTLWKKDSLIQTKALEFGARYLSSQLANLWEIDLQDAEKVRRQYGSLEKQPQYGDELIPLVFRNGKESNQVKRAQFHEKFVELAKDWLNKILAEGDNFSRDEKVLRPHLVFTGTGVAVDGFSEFVQSQFGRDSRVGFAKKVDAKQEFLVDPSLTAALGGFAWLADGAGQTNRFLEHQGFIYKTFAAARSWISAYF